MQRRSLFLFLAICSTVWGSQQVETLDLTHATVQPRVFEPVTGSSSGGGVGSGETKSSIQPAQPIRLTLTELESTQNDGREQFVYEVELKNTSDTTVSIPWGASPRDIEPTPPQPYHYQLASLRLVLFKPSGESERFEAAMLYGSETSRTLRTLKPGECVRIRAATKHKALNRDLTEGNSQAAFRAAWEQYHVTVDGISSRFHETLTPEGAQIQSQNTLPMPNGVSTDR